jgi:hypothetical protein
MFNDVAYLSALKWPYIHGTVRVTRDKLAGAHVEKTVHVHGPQIILQHQGAPHYNNCKILNLPIHTFCEIILVFYERLPGSRESV